MKDLLDLQAQLVYQAPQVCMDPLVLLEILVTGVPQGGLVWQEPTVYQVLLVPC